MAIELSQTISTALKQHQTQEQTLSLQAQQRLAFLQMPLLTMEAALRQKAEQNPFIEFELPKDNVTSIDAAQDAWSANNDESHSEDYFNSGFEGYGDNVDPSQAAEANKKHDYLIVSQTRPETLYEHLVKQATYVTEPDEKRDLLILICDCVDADGYLRQSPHEILQQWFNTRQGITTIEESDVLKAIRQLQSFDPAGVGARSLAECLELQIRADIRYDVQRALYLRLCHHLNHVVSDSPEKLARTLRCTPEELKQALAYLRTLQPYPGRAFAATTPLDTPEIIAIQNASGKWIALCDERKFPLFKLDDEAIKLARAHAKSSEERKCVTELENQASIWVNAYHERNQTLQQVAQYVFDRQSDYLTHGCDSAYLKPLLQRDIAQLIGYDESTISRAVKDKYVRVTTNKKLIQLKQFFTHAIAPTAEGVDSVSDQQAKSAIRALIAAEDPRHPLSDQTLLTLLAKQNIVLARRTIAKYRDQLHIPSTRERRHD